MGPKTDYWLATLLGIVCVAAVWALTGISGVGVSPDSVNYLSAADDIASGRLPRMTSGEHLDLFPPLLPAILAAGKQFGISGVEAGRLVNALAFGLIVLLWCLWALRRLRSPAIKTAAIILFVAASPIFLVSMHLWTEPIFVLLISVWLLSLLEYLEQHGKRFWVLSAACLAVACLLRYTGVAFVLISVPLLLLCLNGIRFRRRLLVVAGYTAVAFLPCALWMMLNAHITGEIMGNRPAAATPFWLNAKVGAYTIANWFNPLSVGDHGYLEKAGVLLVSIGLIAALLHRLGDGKTCVRSLCSSLNPLPFIYVIAAFIGFTVLSASMTAIDSLGDRLMSPVYPLLVAAMVLHFDHALRRDEGHPLPAHCQSTGVFLFVVLISIGGLVRTCTVAQDWRGAGPGGVAGEVEAARIEADLNTSNVASTGELVYSNHPSLLYYLAKRHSHISPRTRHYNSSQRTDDLPRLIEMARQHPSKVALVWFHDVDIEYLFTLEELEKHVTLTSVYEGQTLTVYQIHVGSRKGRSP